MFLLLKFDLNSLQENKVLQASFEDKEKARRKEMAIEHLDVKGQLLLKTTFEDLSIIRFCGFLVQFVLSQNCG